MRLTRSASPAPTTPLLRTCVREKRLAAGLTQAELAACAGVTRQTIIAIERGGYVPSVALALQLARRLGSAVDELFWLDDGAEEGS